MAGGRGLPGELVGGAVGGGVEEVGVELDRLKAEGAARSFGVAADEVFAETVSHSDLAKRTHESFVAARTDVGGWMKLSEGAYFQQRNRVLGL